MCKTCPGVDDCAHDRETDEWPAPARTTAASAPLAPVQVENVSAANPCCPRLKSGAREDWPGWGER